MDWLGTRRPSWKRFPSPTLRPSSAVLLLRNQVRRGRRRHTHTTSSPMLSMMADAARRATARTGDALRREAPDWTPGPPRRWPSHVLATGRHGDGVSTQPEPQYQVSLLQASLRGSAPYHPHTVEICNGTIYLHHRRHIALNNLNTLGKPGSPPVHEVTSRQAAIPIIAARISFVQYELNYGTVRARRLFRINELKLI